MNRTPSGFVPRWRPSLPFGPDPHATSDYANEDGKVVVFFQDSGKFKYRYSTLGCQDAANLDDGDLWRWRTPSRTRRGEKKVVALVKEAVS